MRLSIAYWSLLAERGANTGDYGCLVGQDEIPAGLGPIGNRPQLTKLPHNSAWLHYTSPGGWCPEMGLGSFGIRALGRDQAEDRAGG